MRQTFMKSLKTNARRPRHGASGFSLLEVITVLAISIVVSVISVMSLVPMMKQYRVANAYNTTLAALRQARDNAVSQQTSYTATFVSTTTPLVNSITVTPTLTTFQGVQTTKVYQLPTDVAFLAQSGYPSPGPDGFGIGAAAIDFGYTANSATGGGTVIYFCPDGSAQTTTCGSGGYSNNWDNGVVYIARAGDLLSSRAVTLWGTTGRVHGWRLYPNTSGGYQWVRQ